MKMTDESALAVLDSICDNGMDKPGLPSFAALHNARDYLRARLAADQQKGGGELCPDCGDRVDPNPDENGETRCADCWITHRRATSPQPSIPAPAQQDGKASGGEVDDAMVKRAKVAYNAACDAGRQPCPNCKGTRRERDNYTECGTCEGAGWKWDESAPGPMRAALTAALAHPPHADQETQG